MQGQNAEIGNDSDNGEVVMQRGDNRGDSDSVLKPILS